MTQYLASALSLLGLLGIRQKALWGPLLGTAGSLAWVAYGGITEQWGLALTEVVFALAYASTWLKWLGDAMRFITPGTLALLLVLGCAAGVGADTAEDAYGQLYCGHIPCEGGKLRAVYDSNTALVECRCIPKRKPREKHCFNINCDPNCGLTVWGIANPCCDQFCTRGRLKRR